MGRKVKFSDPEILAAIRGSSKHKKEIAKEYGTSLVTISHIRNFSGPYKVRAQDVGTPVLNAHGVTVGVTDAEVVPVLPNTGE